MAEGGLGPARWHLYLVRCTDGSLYTGITTDVARRVAAHDRNRGARRLRGRGPLQLVFDHAIGSRSEALRVEHWVKRLPRRQKERLITGEIELPRPGPPPVVARERRR